MYVLGDVIYHRNITRPTVTNDLKRFPAKPLFSEIIAADTAQCNPAHCAPGGNSGNPLPEQVSKSRILARNHILAVPVPTPFPLRFPSVWTQTGTWNIHILQRHGRWEFSDGFWSRYMWRSCKMQNAILAVSASGRHWLTQTGSRELYTCQLCHRYNAARAGQPDRKIRSPVLGWRSKHGLLQYLSRVWKS